MPASWNTTFFYMKMTCIFINFEWVVVLLLGITSSGPRSNPERLNPSLSEALIIEFNKRNSSPSITHPGQLCQFVFNAFIFPLILSKFKIYTLKLSSHRAHVVLKYIKKKIVLSRNVRLPFLDRAWRPKRHSLNLFFFFKCSSHNKAHFLVSTWYFTPRPEF